MIFVQKFKDESEVKRQLIIVSPTYKKLSCRKAPCRLNFAVIRSHSRSFKFTSSLSRVCVRIIQL